MDEQYVEGLLEGCPERTGENNPEGLLTFRGKWEEGDREMILGIFKAGGLGEGATAYGIAGRSDQAVYSTLAVSPAVGRGTWVPRITT